MQGRTVVLAERGKGERPASLKADRARRLTYFDAGCPGLMVRVTPKEARTYSCLYKVKGEDVVRRATIGTVEEARDGLEQVSLSDARAKAREILKAAKEGRDLPAENEAAIVARVAERAKAKLEAGSLGDLVERFLTDGKRKKGEPLAPSTLAAYSRTLRRDVVPVLGKIPPRDITRLHVRGLVEGIRRQGHAVQANRTLAATGRLFAWAVENDHLTSSPCVGLRQTTEKARDRVYTPDELRRISERREGRSSSSTSPRSCS